MKKQAHADVQYFNKSDCVDVRMKEEEEIIVQKKAIMTILKKRTENNAHKRKERNVSR